MKSYWLPTLVLLASLAALGQETTRTEARRLDVNGNAIPAGGVSESKNQAGGRTVRTEYGVDASGQRIPLTSSEETKTESNGHTIVQRVVRHYDQNGTLTSTERIQSEEQKLGGGAIEKNTAVYRTDLNGNEMLDERAVSRTDGKTSTTSVEKRGIDGTLTLTERQTTTTETTPVGSKSQSSTFHRDNNGNLFEVVKEVRETAKQGTQTVEKESKYVARGDGSFALQEQTVTRTTPNPDGTVAKRIEVYGEQVPGVTNDSGKPALKEIQTVQVRKAAGGAVVETTTSQQANVTDNGRLTDPKVISETVLTKTTNQ